MKAAIDPDACTGCGLCEATCPQVFVVEGDIAVVQVDPVPAELEVCAQEAANDCPTEAILITE